MITLPTPINVVLDRYEAENQPYKKFIRLISVFESLLKYLAIISIQDFYRGGLNTTYPNVHGEICRHISRPSLGSWMKLLDNTLGCFTNHRDKLFIGEIYPFFFQNSRYELARTHHIRIMSGLIELRNLYSGHGTALSDDESSAIMKTHHQSLVKLLEKASFLGKYPLVYAEKSENSNEFPVRKFHASRKMQYTPEVIQFDELKSEHLYICDPRNNEYLDLYPLLTYQVCGAPVAGREDEPSKCEESKFFFFNSVMDRGQYDYLDYLRGHHYFIRTEQLPEFQLRFGKVKRKDGEWFENFIQSTNEFYVERETEEELLNTFVATAKKRALVFIGEPGIGKTALLGQWSMKNQCPRHFFREGNADSLDLSWFYENLTTQIADQAEIRWTRPGETDLAVHRREFLKVLKSASVKVNKIVIVLDGLDELVRSSDEGESLLRDLPDTRDLPSNVYLIVSTRPELVVTDFFHNKFGLPVAVHREISPMNEDDVRFWLSQSCSQYEVLDNPEYIRAIVQKSKGNALYLKFLLADIFDYRIQFGDVDKLPEGVRNYYERILQGYKNPAQNVERELRIFSKALDGLVRSGTLSDQQRDEELSRYRKEISSNHPSWGRVSQILALLCSVNQPISKQVISEILDIEIEDVSRVLKTTRSVLLETEQQTYSIFHSGFREYFLELNLDLVNDQHQRAFLLPFVKARIINWCRNWQRHNNSYALRYIVAHLGENPETEDEIYALAENTEFLHKQSEIDVYLPVHTIESVLNSAISQDNCPKIVGLAMKLAEQLEIARKNNPLVVLDKLGVKQATLVADLYEPKGSFIWYLLIAREVLRTHGKESAILVLKQLQEKQIPFPIIHDEIYKEFSLLTKELLALLDQTTFQTLWEITGSYNYRVLDYLVRNDMIPMAVKLAQEIANPVDRTDTLTWIGVRQVLYGHAKGALATIMLVDPKNRGEAWREIFAMQLLVARLKFAGKWFDDEAGVQISHDTAVDLAGLGDYSSALSIIRWCSAADRIDKDLFDVTLAFGSSHKISILFQLAANIRERELRERLFCSIAMAEAKMGLFEQAVGTLRRASRYYEHHLDTIDNPAWRYVLEQYYDTTEMVDARSLASKDDDYPDTDLFPRWAFLLVLKVLRGELNDSLDELNQLDHSLLEDRGNVERNRRYYCFVLMDLYCERVGFTEKTKTELESIAKRLTNLRPAMDEFLEHFNSIAEQRIKRARSFSEPATALSISSLFPSLIKEASKTAHNSETAKQRNAMLFRIVELNLRNQNAVDADSFFRLMLQDDDSYNKALSAQIQAKTEQGDIPGALELAKNDKYRLEYICRILASQEFFEQALQIGEAKYLYEENVCTSLGFSRKYLNDGNLELANTMVQKAVLNLLRSQGSRFDALLYTGGAERTFLEWTFFDEPATEWILKEFVSSIANTDPALEIRLPDILLAQALYEIADYQHKKGWAESARVTMCETINRLESSKNNLEKINLALKIAHLEVQLGEKDQAVSMLQNLLLVADQLSIDDLEFSHRDALRAKQQITDRVQDLLVKLREGANLEERSFEIEYENDGYDGMYGEDLYDEIVNGDYSSQEILMKVADWLDSWTMHDSDDDIWSDMHSDGLFMLESLAEHFCRQGNDDLSVGIIQLIGNEYRRSSGYSRLALIQIEKGSFQYAYDLLQKITVYQSEHFSRIAEAFAKQGAWEYFKKMIIPMSHYQSTAYCCIRLLPDLYPEQFDDYMLAVLEAEQ